MLVLAFSLYFDASKILIDTSIDTAWVDLQGTQVESLLLVEFWGLNTVIMLQARRFHTVQREKVL